MLLTGDLQAVTETFGVDVFGPLRGRAFAPILAANNGGVVNMRSRLSWLAGSAHWAPEAAAWSVTNSLRLELVPQNTQVVGVHAGFIDTDMASAIERPKTAAAAISARIVDSFEGGDVEVLADDVTVTLKAALSGPVEQLTFSAAS